MFSLDLDCMQDDKDMLIADLWEQGSSGIIELDSGQVRAFFDDDADRARLAALFGGVPVEADGRDWVALAQERLQPTEVGERFFLVPRWRDDPAPAGRFRIEVNNGLAFGTGAHETTRLCIELLEKYVRAGMTVVDVGTGSGILAQAARCLGAAVVVGCDVDESAIEVAKATGIPMFVGSAAAVGSGMADVVVANISPECLTEMAAEWTRMLKAGGVAILSGIEKEDLVAIEAGEIREEGNWRAMVVFKEVRA
jgi:ribosomal protein L11 methyltransferase